LTGTFLVVIDKRNSKLWGDLQKFYKFIILVFNVNISVHWIRWAEQNISYCFVPTVTEVNLLNPVIITNTHLFAAQQCTTVISVEHRLYITQPMYSYNRTLLESFHPCCLSNVK